MDINQLRTFATVAREGNLTRATELLFLSQPAISGQIKALEEELCVKLFSRTPRGVVLTAEGERLLGDAERVLSAHAEMLSHAKGLGAAVSGKVRLGMPAKPEMLRIGEFMNRLAKDYPGIQVQLQHAQTGDVLSAVRAGKLDCGYVIGDGAVEGLSFFELKRFEIHVVAPAAWKERVAGAGWDEILALPWVWRTGPSFCYQIEQQIFNEKRVKPNVAVEVDNPNSAERLVAAGVGVALMHDEEATRAEAAGDIVRWDGAALAAALYFVHRSERGADPVIAAVASVVRDGWAPPAD